MFNKCEFKKTPAYLNLKRFLFTNSNINIKTNPIVHLLIKIIYEKIINTPLSKEQSRYANKNCQLIFDYLNEIILEDIELNGKKLFKIVKESEYKKEEEELEINNRIINIKKSITNTINTDYNNINILPNINITLEGIKYEGDKFLIKKEIEEFKTINISKSDLLILKGYLKNSYGNSQRSDFGTGHELNFLCFLYCLNKFTPINIINSMELYYFSSRSFIIKFKLEAAGSKGVWGVDDYEIISFFLIGNCIGGNEKMSNCFYNPFIKNLVQFVCTYKKTINLIDNSPFLFDILNETGFEIKEKVEERMERELWGSFVVMQHFIYSKFLKKSI